MRSADYAIPQDGIALQSAVLCLDDDVVYDARREACPRCGNGARTAPAIIDLWHAGAVRGTGDTMNLLAAYES